MIYIKRYEEYRFIPFDNPPNKYDRNEPFWIWKKKKYKEEKLKKQAAFGNTEIGTEINEEVIVLNLKRINEILEEKLSEKLKELLKKIKQITIVYEQSDDYPESSSKYFDLEEKDIEILKEIGFGVNEEKNKIYWKWRDT